MSYQHDPTAPCVRTLGCIAGRNHVGVCTPHRGVAQEVDDGNEGDSRAITAFATAVKNDSPFAPVLGAGLLARFQRLRARRP